MRIDKLVYQYNQCAPDDDHRWSILKDILGIEEIPEGVTLLQPVYFDYGEYTRIGEYTFVNHGCYFMDGGGITIGKHVFIGPFCGFYTAQHPLQYEQRNKGLEKALPIVVGDNCWFGAHAAVMPGVTIGSGSVIAAGSVVTKDVPDNVLVAGVPARIVREIEQDN